MTSRGLWLFLSLWVLNGQAAPVQILSAEINSAGTQVVFTLSKPVSHQLFSLEATPQKPHRLVIDFYDAAWSGDLYLPANPLIFNIRSAARNKKNLRIVLDLNAPVQFNAKQFKPQGRQGHQLTIELNPQQNSKKAAQNKVPPLSSPPLAPIRISKPIYKDAAQSYSPPQAVATPKPQILEGDGREIIIAVDAGHGGVDPGAIGPGGTREKAIAFAIALELTRLFEQTPGVRAILTRGGDYFLSLRGRMERARDYKADLFISIHADAFESGKQSQGASVYMLSPRGASSEAAKWLAEKENAADLLGGVSLTDKDDILASVLLDLSQTGTLEASSQLGGQVLSALGKISPLHLRKVQQAAFMVLRSPDIPSILVESGFISNPAEEQKLKTPAYQQYLAQALQRGILNYLQKHAPPGTLLVQQNGMIAQQ